MKQKKEIKGYDESVGQVLSSYLIINCINLTVKQSINIPLITNVFTMLLGVGYFNILFHEKRYLSIVIKKLLVLPDDTIVYPGHGKSTLIKEEKPIYLELRPRED